MGFMKRMAKWMAVLLMTLTLSTGCGSGSKTTPPEASSAPKGSEPAAKEPVKPSATGGNQQAVRSKTTDVGLTEREIDTAQSILPLYFDAVVNRDTDLLNFLQADTAGTKTKPVPKGSKFATLEEVKVLKALVQDGAPTVFFAVTVDLGPSPGGAWNPGINQRWAEIRKTNDGWKVKSMATSPPSL